LRRHLTFANLASGLALLVALTTSGAYAASQLAPKSVGERQLRPGAVTASKLRKNAVTSPKIKVEAITQGKLASSSVSTDKLATSSVSTAKLQDSVISTDKLADGSATGQKVNESTLSQVPSAARADTATFAEVANPAAFASVAKDGTLDPEASKGITAVKEFEVGVYGLTASFSPRGAVVTPKLPATGTLTAYARLGGGASPCPSPQVEVQIRNSEGKATEAAFFALLYR
jgi:hypothetical protein